MVTEFGRVPAPRASRWDDWAMSNGVLSFPFRLSPDGTAATTGRGTDAEVDEAIAVLCLTHLGERHMTPGFGIPDPAYAGLHVGDVQVGLDDYGPAGITVTELTKETVTETMDRAKVVWSYTENGTDSSNG